MFARRLEKGAERKQARMGLWGPPSLSRSRRLIKVGQGLPVRVRNPCTAWDAEEVGILTPGCGSYPQAVSRNYNHRLRTCRGPL